MFADNGVATLTVDLDPQASLTAMFLDAECLESLWALYRPSQHGIRQYPADITGGGDIATPHVEPVAERLSLIPGDLGLYPASRTNCSMPALAATTATSPPTGA